VQVIAGHWLFGWLTCDIFNANDVLFSTASLLHLCCISWDRYIAVTDPFNYERRMTRRRAALTLAGVWTASACLSHIPIHLGLYTTPSQRNKLATDTNECSFKVAIFSARDSLLRGLGGGYNYIRRPFDGRTTYLSKVIKVTVT